MRKATHKPRHTPKPATAPADTLPAPTTPDTDPDTLTNDEEEAFSLLVEIAEARSRDSTGAEGAQKKPPQKTRVEFSQLVTRARAVRFLLSYFSGDLPSVAMKSAGIGWGDLQICRIASPEFDRAFKFCRDSTGDRLALKALEAAEKALNGQEVSNSAASLSKFLLERLQADRFGDPRYKGANGGANGGGSGNVYQINLIQTAAPAPAVCGGNVAEIARNVQIAQKEVINV